MPLLPLAGCPAAFALLLLASVAPSASAQEVARGPLSTLYAADGAAVAGPPRSAEAVRAAWTEGPVRRVAARRRAGAATFEVDYSAGFTAEAQAAFQFAVDIWALHVDSAVPIRVRADFSDLEEGVLGSAGPNIVRFGPSPPAGAEAATWYPFALADALAGRDLNPEPGDFFYDVTAQFSSARDDFYFGLDGDPPPGQFDFVTIVLHELGHGLGFLGSGTVDDGDGDAECTGTDGEGCWGFLDGTFEEFPFIFDRSLDDAAGVPMLDESVYPNPSLALGGLLQSEALFVDAPTVVALQGGPAPVWAPSPFESGSSFSHWDEAAFADASDALMTPRVARGEAYQDPGAITCGFFRDMGWPLSVGCQSLVDGDGPIDPPAPPPPSVDALTLRPTGPNPFHRSTTVRVLLPEAVPLRVELVDVLGRVVAVPFDGAGRIEQTVRIGAGGLASGVYFLVVRTATEEAVLGLTVAR